MARGTVTNVRSRPSGATTISAGGTISNRTFESTANGTPCVILNTTSPVTFDRCVFRHKGEAIRWSPSGTQLTVTNSKFFALNHLGVQTREQRVVNLFQPASLVFEHNYMESGTGVFINGNGATLSPLRVRYNDCKNIGRWGTSVLSQFFQLNNGVAQAEISWNRTFNEAGKSNVEDNINLFGGTSGVSSSQLFDIHHNMIRGAYAYTSDGVSGDGSGYTGGGILIGDAGGNHCVIQNNRVVGTSNYGVSLVGGQDNYLLNNRVVNDGKTEAGVVHGPDFAVGAAVWNASVSFPTGPNTWASGNYVKWQKPDGTRNNLYTPSCNPSGNCSSNTVPAGTVTAQEELDEWDAWLVDLAAASLTVGPNW